MSEDETFTRVIATAKTIVSPESDWTCRALVGNLLPSSTYWYRFVDKDGNASRVGRTLTAPADDSDRPVKSSFVSCQNLNHGALNAYRRMIFDDERASGAEKLSFVLHLGDFIYEAIWYPEDNPDGQVGRRLRDILRYPHGERVDSGSQWGAFYIPVTLDDYRAIYRAYLRDPDLQDARALAVRLHVGQPRILPGRAGSRCSSSTARTARPRRAR